MNSFFKILTPVEKQVCESISNNQDSLLKHEDLFNKLYDHFTENGEMPYSVQKARDEDPLSWIEEKIEKEFQKYH